MDWIVVVSADERVEGKLAPATEAAALAALDHHGCILLRGAFAPATIEAMHGEYVSQLGTMDLAAMAAATLKPAPNRHIMVGPGRYDTTLRMTGAFGRMDVFANDVLLRFLRPLLGKDMRLNSFTAVASYPGAAGQQPHRDHDHLYPQPGVGPGLPIYAVNVAVPLIDVDLTTGPTGVWLGSHRSGRLVAVQGKDMAAQPLQRGDCMLLDYRTLHTGLPNRSDQVRPIVYMVYGRRWFFDDVNYVKRIPLDMPLERYHELPESVRPLLVRAFSYAMLTRWREAELPGAAAMIPNA